MQFVLKLGLFFDLHLPVKASEWERAGPQLFPNIPTAQFTNFSECVSEQVVALHWVILAML